MKIKNNDVLKIVTSPNYNYLFNKITGYFARWGNTKNDDPIYAPFGNEIADIEISTICNGIRCEDNVNRKLCSFCYKGNSSNGKNMSFETFKKLLDKILESNKCLTQIAFGSGSTAEENPDIWNIMKYCRDKDIVPNITVADISDETADRLVEYCGAVAVSRYFNKNRCYDSVEKLTLRGLTQCNIHQMISEESYEQTLETLHDIKTDSRLKKLNAIVFLSLKTKGRAENGFNQLSQDKFNNIIKICFDNNITWGADSCSAHKAMKSIENRFHEKELKTMIEPCESSLMSFYINVEGLGFPCSFSENVDEWINGIDIINCGNFLKDVWYNDKLVNFRNKLITCNRNCPIYKI